MCIYKIIVWFIRLRHKTNAERTKLKNIMNNFKHKYINRQWNIYKLKLYFCYSERQRWRWRRQRRETTKIEDNVQTKQIKKLTKWACDNSCKMDIGHTGYEQEIMKKNSRFAVAAISLWRALLRFHRKQLNTIHFMFLISIAKRFSNCMPKRNSHINTIWYRLSWARSHNSHSDVAVWSSNNKFSKSAKLCWFILVKNINELKLNGRIDEFAWAVRLFIKSTDQYTFLENWAQMKQFLGEIHSIQRNFGMILAKKKMKHGFCCTRDQAIGRFRRTYVLIYDLVRFKHLELAKIFV